MLSRVALKHRLTEVSHIRAANIWRMFLKFLCNSTGYSLDLSCSSEVHDLKALSAKWRSWQLTEPVGRLGSRHIIGGIALGTLGHFHSLSAPSQSVS